MKFSFLDKSNEITIENKTKLTKLPEILYKNRVKNHMADSKEEKSTVMLLIY